MAYIYLFRALFSNYRIPWPETIINVNNIYRRMTNAFTTNTVSDSTIRYSFGHTIKTLNL